MTCYKCGGPDGTAALLCKSCIEQGRNRQASGVNSIRTNVRSAPARTGSGEMKRNLGIGILALLGCSALFLLVSTLQRRFGQGGPIPAVEEIADIAKEYVIAEKRANCDGELEVEFFDVLRVGPADEFFEGFPVYANSSIVCHKQSANLKMRSRSKTDGNSNTAITTVRRRLGGGYEAFTSDRIKAVEAAFDAQMQQQLKKMSGSFGDR